MKVRFTDTLTLFFFNCFYICWFSAVIVINTLRSKNNVDTVYHNWTDYQIRNKSKTWRRHIFGWLKSKLSWAHCLLKLAEDKAQLWFYVFLPFFRFENKERFLSMSSVLEQQSHQLNASPTPTQVSVGPGPWKHNSLCPHESVNSAGCLPVDNSCQLQLQCGSWLGRRQKSFQYFSILRNVPGEFVYLSFLVMTAHPKDSGPRKDKLTWVHTWILLFYFSSLFPLSILYLFLSLNMM